jgi:hypothetical protein
VAEYWSHEVDKLQTYIDQVEGKTMLFVKKILKVVLRQTITGLTAIEPTGGNPIRNQRLAI